VSLAAALDPVAESNRLLDFAEAAVRPDGGFWWLDEAGRPDHGRGLHTWIAARMTYVFTLAALGGRRGATGIAEHGVSSLAELFADPVAGGWFASVCPDDHAPVEETKQAYQHAFVLLAAAAATAAQIRGGEQLLDEALKTVEDRFLDDRGRVVDRYDRGFTHAEAYRGANASMHLVEALLPVGELRGPRWHQVALGIAEHLVHEVARDHGYRMPEHFDADWTPLPDYHRERPRDQFRPYGWTPGHLLEWSRLLVQLEATVSDPPGWLLADARGLFSRGLTGWAVNGRPGFCYTMNFDDTPVISSRLHWVHAEAMAAAAALHRRTGEACYAEHEQRWRGFIAEYLRDGVHGSWHHELDPANRPADGVWSGKPDVYHGYLALLLPGLRPAPSAPVQLAGSVSGG